MSLNRYAARVDENQEELVTLARKLGAHLWNIKEPCDWLVLIRGVWWPVEIKTVKGGFTDKQKKFIKKVEAAGGQILVWRTAEDVIHSCGGQ